MWESRNLLATPAFYCLRLSPGAISCPALAAEGLAKGPAEAEAMMKAERPRVRLNKRQKAALKQWAAAQDGRKRQ